MKDVISALFRKKVRSSANYNTYNSVLATECLMSGFSTDWGSPSGTGVPPSAVMSVSSRSVILAGLFSPTQVFIPCLYVCVSLCLPTSY